MKTSAVPEQSNSYSSQSVQLVDYHSSQQSVKQQIILNQNMFSFLSEGTKEVFFDNSNLSIDNSKILLMKSGYCLMTESPSKTSSYRSTLLFFSNEVLLKFAWKNKINRAKATDCLSARSFHYDDFVRRFLMSLLDISGLSGNTRDKLLKVKFEEIMLYLMDKYGTGFLHSLIANSNEFEHKFTQTIESNKLNRLTLKELAFLCNMSISSFKRQFEKHYSESPIKWFQNKRLEYAHYLIGQKQKSPSEIYFEIGYENLSSFIQAYKEKYGTTPKRLHKN